MGAYIREYEQNGADRSRYGEALLGKLSGKLRSHGLERMDERELRRYRLFYMTYPGIWETLSPEFRSLLPVETWPSLSAHATLPDVAPDRRRLFEPTANEPWMGGQDALRYGHDLPSEYLPAEAGERAPMLNTLNAKPYQRHYLGNHKG